MKIHCLRKSCPLSRKPRKAERIPTIRDSTFFRGDDSVSQLDCWKFPPSGDPALGRFSARLWPIFANFSYIV